MPEEIHTASGHIVKLPTYKTVKNRLHDYFLTTFLSENSHNITFDQCATILKDYEHLMISLGTQVNTFV